MNTESDPRTPGRDEKTRALFFQELGRLPEEAREFLSEAMNFAQSAHENQTRQSGEIYFNHPLRIATRCLRFGLDSHCVAGALLHDVIEDTKEDFKSIEKRFGKQIANLVLALTKVKADQKITLRRLLIHGQKDFRVLLIKLFDRLDNLRDIDSLSRAKQIRICRETLGIYANIAHGLGLNQFYEELRDKAYRTLNARLYQKIKKQSEQLKEKQKDFFDQCSLKIGEALKDLPNAEVQCHLKETHSLMLKQEKMDLILDRFLILTECPLECYNVVGHLHTKFRAIPRTFRDYLSNPMANGKKTLETNVLLNGNAVKIEITTRKANQTNQFGVINLIREKIYQNDDYKKLLELYLEFSEEDDLRIEDVFEKRSQRSIQVFTPDNHCFEMRPNSTVLDFAFQVHTDVGLKCSGASVNHTRSPIAQRLFDGDVVKILTDDRVKPEKSWLDNVKMPKSRKELTKYYRSQIASSSA